MVKIMSLQDFNFSPRFPPKCKIFSLQNWNFWTKIFQWAENCPTS